MLSTSEVPAVQEQALKALDDIGKLYEQENEERLRDTRNYGYVASLYMPRRAGWWWVRRWDLHADRLSHGGWGVYSAMLEGETPGTPLPAPYTGTLVPAVPPASDD